MKYPMIILVFATLFASSFFLGSCSDQEIVAVKEHKLSDIVTYSGWEFKNHNVDNLLNVEKWLAGLSGQKIIVDWQRYTTQNDKISVVTAVCENKGQKTEYGFLVSENADNFLITLNVADAAHVWENLSTFTHVSSSFSALPRIAEVDRLSSNDAYFLYDGCFVYNGEKSIKNLNLRATFLVSDAENKHHSYTGKIKTSTKRSGIPEEISPGQYFCVKLKSEKIPHNLAEKGILQAIGVVEAGWVNSLGLIEFSPLFVKTLNWAMYSGEPINSLVLVQGGELEADEERGSKVLMSDPSLVTLLNRRGRTMWVKLDEGQLGSIDSDRIITIYQQAMVKVDDDTQKLIKNFVTYSVMGKFDMATSLFDLSDKTLGKNKVLEEIKRKFPDNFKDEPIDVSIKILESNDLENAVMVSYFIWLKKDMNTIWRGFDTVLVSKKAEKKYLLADEY